MNIYLQAQSYCLAQGIKIYIVALQRSKEVKIEVDNNGKIIQSPNTYKTQKIASEKIWDIYLNLYKKLNNDKNSKH